MKKQLWQMARVWQQAIATWSMERGDRASWTGTALYLDPGTVLYMDNPLSCGTHTRGSPGSPDASGPAQSPRHSSVSASCFSGSLDTWKDRQRQAQRWLVQIPVGGGRSRSRAGTARPPCDITGRARGSHGHASPRLLEASRRVRRPARDRPVGRRRPASPPDSLVPGRLRCLRRQSSAGR